MKKLFLLLAAVVMTFGHAYAQDENLVLKDFKESLSAGGLANQAYELRKNTDWGKTDEEKPCALIRVKISNLTHEQARQLQLTFTAGNTQVDKIVPDYLVQNNAMEFFVSPSDNASFYLLLQGFGRSNVIRNVKLVGEHVYEVSLMTNKTVDIKVIPWPEKASVYFGNQKDVDGVLKGLPLGNVQLKIVDTKGNITFKNIDVVDGKPLYDLRPTKNIRIEADKSSAEIELDGKVQDFRTPITMEIPYGWHVIKVFAGIEAEQKSLNIDANTPEVLKFSLRETASFTVQATYNGSNRESKLILDGKVQNDGNYAKSHSLTLEVGTKHRIELQTSYGNQSETVKVGNNQKDITYKIKTRKSFTWPWEREYNHAIMGVEFGYVQKNMVSSNGNSSRHFNYAWPQKRSGRWDYQSGTSLNGFRGGVIVQPVTKIGFGLYTGLFYEIFFSTNNNFEYNSYVEQAMSLPLQLMYNIPLGRRFNVAVRAGVGFDLSLAGQFSKSGSSSDSDKKSVEWGFESAYPMPNAFQASLEFGASMRIGPMQVNASWSKGLNDNRLVEHLGLEKTRLGKFTVGIAWVLEEDD